MGKEKKEERETYQCVTADVSSLPISLLHPRRQLVLQAHLLQILLLMSAASCVYICVFGDRLSPK